MSDVQACRELVMQYVKSVHTQKREDFNCVFSDLAQCRLISVGTEYVGKDSIYEDFLINAIRAAFSDISLVVDDLSFNQISHDMMVIVFRYHTECILRESGESFGIQGLETQIAIREDTSWRLVHVHYSKI